MFCAIWYHMYNLKNVKDTHEGVLLCEVAAARFKLYKWYQIAQRITWKCKRSFVFCYLIGTISLPQSVQVRFSNSCNLLNLLVQWVRQLLLYVRWSQFNRSFGHWYLWFVINLEHSTIIVIIIGTLSQCHY